MPAHPPSHGLEALEARALLSSYLYNNLEDALALHNPIRTIDGDASPLAGFGTVVESLGDIDADGVADVGVAAPGFAPIFPPLGSPGLAGSAFLYSGRTGELIRSITDGEYSFGASMANLGDVNADGIPDLLVGSPGYVGAADVTSGRAYIYSGADGSVLRTFEGQVADGDFGRVVSRINDANDDGVQDVIIGAPGRASSFIIVGEPNPSVPGAVYIFSGADGSLIRSHAGVNPGDNFGRSIAVPGNEGDDRQFYAIGAWGFDGTGGTDAGRVYVFTLDGALAYTLDGERAGDFFGASVIVVPNVASPSGVPGGDHRLVVGAPGSDYGIFVDQPAVVNRGRVESFNLADGMFRVVGEANDATEGAAMGAQLALAPDLDLDGAADVSVLAPGSGHVYVFTAALNSFNSFNSSVASPALDGSFTTPLESIGDVNDDGIPDFIAGAASESGGDVRILSSLGIGAELRIDGASDDLGSIWSNRGRRVLLVDGVPRAFDHVVGLTLMSRIQAIGDDGTIYFVEETGDGQHSDLMVLRDGAAVTLESLVTSVVGQTPDYNLLRAVKVGGGGHVLLTTGIEFAQPGLPFLFFDGVLTTLPTAGAWSDVNASGIVVGVLDAAGAMWTAEHGVTPIPELAGDLAINDAGDIVGIRAGTITFTNPGTIAVLSSGVVTDLGGVLDSFADSAPSWDIVDFDGQGRVLAVLLRPARGSGSLTTYIVDASGFRSLTEATHRIPSGAIFGSVSSGVFMEFNPFVAFLAEDGRVVAYDAVLNGIPDSEVGTLRADSPVTSITVGGVRYVAGVNQYDEIVIFRYEGDSWSVRRVRLEAAQAGLDEMVFVADPEGAKPVLVVSSGGVLYVHAVDADAQEPGHPLSGFDGRTGIVRGLTTFTNVEGVAHLAGFDEAGDLVIYFRNRAQAIGAYTGWNYDNLSQTHLASQGIETPNIVSKLTAYATSWSGMNLAGIDENGHIQAIWWSPESVFWKATDLTASVTGPQTAYVGELTAFVTPWNTIHINGTNSMGRIRALWWAPGFGGAWHDQPLPQVFVDSASMDSWVTPWGGLNIVARSASEPHDTYVFWWTPDTNEWLVNQLPARNATVVLEGRIDAVVETGGAVITQNVYGRGENDDLVRMFWTPGQDFWLVDNVTEDLG